MRRSRIATALGAVVLLMGTSQSLASPAISYNRGPVMSALHAHVIVWTPRGSHFESRDDRYVSLLQAFFRSLGGSPYYGILKEYASAPGFGPVLEGPLTTVAGLSGIYVDRRPFPHDGGDRSSLAVSAMQQEITRDMHLRGWKPSLHDLYIVLVPAGVHMCVQLRETCTDFARGPLRQLSACATHQYFVTEDQPVLYLYLPVVYRQKGCLPDVRSTFRRSIDPAAAAELDALARELFDTVTDPVGTGWYAGTPVHEMGDLCPGVRGVHLRSYTLSLPFMWARRLGKCSTSGR